MWQKLGIFSIVLVLVFSCNSGTPEDGSSKSDEGEIVAEKIYNTHCGICHGDDGKKGLGRGKIASRVSAFSERANCANYQRQGKYDALRKGIITRRN